MKAIFTGFLLFFIGFLSHAQTFTVVADSLRSPFGLEFTSAGKLRLTEVGTGNNDGQISEVKSDGTLLPIIVGLPSIFDTVEHETVGVWRSVELPGNLMAVVGPLLGGGALFNMTGFTPGTSAPMTAASATAQVVISPFVFMNEPDTLPDSDPFSLALDASNNTYICDAAFNGIVKVAFPTGAMSVFAQFPSFPNPLPFGPPMVDAVPTRIIAKPGGGFYVCQLTGFPFLPGAASIFEVSATGVISTYATGLTLLTDLYLDAPTGNLYALQFGEFSLDPMAPGFVPNSSKVTRIKPNGVQEVVAQNFGPSSCMTFNSSGDLYVSELYSGRLLKTNGILSSTETPENVVEMTISPNPARDFARISFSLKQASTVGLRILDEAGRTVFEENQGRLDAGNHEIEWLRDGASAGLYFVEIRSEGTTSVQKLILK